jgi:hypothetical protein
VPPSGGASEEVDADADANDGDSAEGAEGP